MPPAVSSFAASAFASDDTSEQVAIRAFFTSACAKAWTEGAAAIAGSELSLLGVSCPFLP
eukprot:CAMPEP_0178404282 /NCGR_PEP_ID=MMETSP0689_2-20121128/17801_1 /TAXON_ID=160604 /ORGANISM="Amphidinium massartii, Strain CS-259" /LENGTH=59 /DNA_ID=CAMNT_0020025257 /DNA_START=601 /DNA_END=777 /DNA_ORIENTATION=+